MNLVPDLGLHYQLYGSLHKSLRFASTYSLPFAEPRRRTTSERQRPYSRARAQYDDRRRADTHSARTELPKDRAAPALSCQHWTRRVLRWLLCRGKPVSGADNKDDEAGLSASLTAGPWSGHHSSTFHDEQPIMNHRPVYSWSYPSIQNSAGFSGHLFTSGSAAE